MASFIVRAKRARYLSLLQSPQKRQKILDRLNHTFDIDMELAHVITCRDPASIEPILLSLGAKPTGCYLISDSSNLDAREVTLSEGLRLAHESFFGSLLDCLPGKLALYWNEAGPHRKCFLLTTRPP